jgi:hypothetical protein
VNSILWEQFLFWSVISYTHTAACSIILCHMTREKLSLPSMFHLYAVRVMIMFVVNDFSNYNVIVGWKCPHITSQMLQHRTRYTLHIRKAQGNDKCVLIGTHYNRCSWLYS